MVNMKPTTENRKPYGGLTRSLVIAIDVGTTFSGVSYAILEPGEIPKIHGVTRFPGQEHVAGNTKIPSTIYYDKHGKMMAAGAEAETSSIVAQAEDEGWVKTDLFKLRLRPRTMQLNMNGMRLGPLPRRKTAVDVFGDFLAYLFRCTRNFITDTHGNGAALWNTVENSIQFVLSHPNGWEGAQQTKMRRSAVYGGLIPDTNEGRARIRFVTEGEASLHACVLNGLAADVLLNPSKHGFLIADAGGGTLDISSYAIRGTHPLVMEEIAPPDCIFAGSIFVSRRAREFLQEKLKNSKYGTPDALDHITQRFDETTKRLFRDRKELQFIPFGSPLDKDPAVGIRNGQLKLTGNEVANLFEPSVDAAVNAIKVQIEASNGIIRSVFLVGGYAASPWLFNQLQERLAPLSITVSRPDTQTSKAVADGAIGFYCDHHVSARMSKFMYGVEFLRELDPTNQDHVARKERLCELPSGPKLLPDAFDCILKRSVKVKESMVFTRKYCTELTSLSMLSVFEVEIWCYRGGNITPEWIDRQADDFSTLCVVRADLSPLAGSAEPKSGKSGKTYWTIVFSVEIHFGLTEFKARIKWVDDGKTKYGPASIIYNERGHRANEEEPDTYPEDDAATSSPHNDRLRSEPASRARTPIEQFYHPSSTDARRPEASPIKPESPVVLPSTHRERIPSLSKPLLSPFSAIPLEPPRELSRGFEQEKTEIQHINLDRTSSFSNGMLSSPSALPSVGKSYGISLSPGLEKDVEKETLQDKKKGKGKAKTPKSTPTVEEYLPPAIERTSSANAPQVADFSSTLWTTDPIAPADSKAAGLGWGSISLSAKEKEKELLGMSDIIGSKASPAVGSSRSPLTEPVVVADVAALSAPSISPIGISTSAKASPVTIKKGKKKGASAVATPAVEHTEPFLHFVDPAPSSGIGAAGTTHGTSKTDLTPLAAATVAIASTEKPVSAMLTPIGLPEVTLSTKTPEPGSLSFADEDVTSSLFNNSNTWGNNDAIDNDNLESWGFGKVKTPKSRQSPKTVTELTKADNSKAVEPEIHNDGFDSWNFGKPKTPKSRQSPKPPVPESTKAEKVNVENAEAQSDSVDSWGLHKPKTPRSRQSPKTLATEPTTTENSKVEETETQTRKLDDFVAETLAASSMAPDIKPGWGATPKTPAVETSATTGVGWGASTAKKPGWGTPSSKPGTPGWGSGSLGSFGAAKTTEAKTPVNKTPWSSKLNTPAKTPSSPWGAKTMGAETKESTKEEAKEETSSKSPIPPTGDPISKHDDVLIAPGTAPAEDPSATGPLEVANASSKLTPIVPETSLPAEEPTVTKPPSPQTEEKTLESAIEPETPLDLTSPTGEDGEDADQKDEEEKDDKKGNQAQNQKKNAPKKKKKKK